MTDPVFAIGEWATNAEMIADVATLGYLNGKVLDPTWGEANWWTKWRPDDLTTHDYKIDGVDFRHLPHADATFNAIAFDPPYKLNGTPSGPDAAYGVDVVATRDGRHQLMLDGLTECARVLAPDGYLLVKCQDQVEGGKVRWQTDMMTGRALELGLRKVDAFLFRAYRPQPEGRAQQHARRNYSTLLIFRAPKTHNAATLL